MNLNIFLNQEEAESFFRSKLNNISDVSLIQDTSEKQPINGQITWFCKSGGEKFVSRRKGQLEPFSNTDFSNSFRNIDRGTGFIFNDQVYSFGHKGRIGHPRLVDASSTLRNACAPKLLRKKQFIEKFYRIKCISSGIVINYCFGLFARGEKYPIVHCLAFQEEANFFDPEQHCLEEIKPGQEFQFLGGSYYAYSLNNWDMMFAAKPNTNF